MDTPLRIEVGKRLKEARNMANFTQKQVAEKLGMVQSAYARYEIGKIELDYEKLHYLCRLFEVSADFILCIDDANMDSQIKYTEEFTYSDGTHSIKHKKKK